MTTNDKHCQTQLGGEDASVVRGEDAVMFDESVAVEGQEVDSSTSSEDGAVRAAMSKFQPPARHTARHDFDSDSDSSPGKLTADLSEEDLSPQRRAKSPEKHEASKGGERPRQTRRASSNSESDSGEEVDACETVAGPGARRRGPALPAEGAYDPEHFRDLKVPPDMENLFQYISKYTPQKIELEGRLRAFVPECAPAVGDCDALLKLSTPLATLLAKPLDDRLLEHIDNLADEEDLRRGEESESDRALDQGRERAARQPAAARRRVRRQNARHRQSDGGVAGVRGGGAERGGFPGARAGVLAGAVRGAGGRAARRAAGRPRAAPQDTGGALALLSLLRRQELAALRAETEGDGGRVTFASMHDAARGT